MSTHSPRSGLHSLFLHALIALLISNLAGAGTVAAGGAARATVRTQTSKTTASDAVLLFTIGLHIEPFGATISQLVGGGPPPNPQGPNYNTQPFFQRHVADIKAVTNIVERHGGRMTVQAQTPFTRVAAQSGEPILADLEARGHQLALHFHEDAHLGRNPERLSVQLWAAVMKEEIESIHQAGVKQHLRYWSGGNLYSGILDAAAQAGLDVNSDWKDPRTQTTDATLLGVNPWRPAGGPTASDVAAFAQHDPDGQIIFLPEGNYSRTDFASSRRSGEFGGDQGYFDYLKSELQRSMDAAQPDRVNVFHFTVHPGEFRGSSTQPFAVIDQWLTDVIDPLVQTGKVRWATFAQMADAFKAWEQANPGTDPRTASQSGPESWTLVHDADRDEAQPPGPPFPSFADVVALAPTSQNPSDVLAPAAHAPVRPDIGKTLAGASLDAVQQGRVERDVTYCTADGVALKLDIYYPTNAAGRAPVAVYVHGGGWASGDKSSGTGVQDIPTLVGRGYLVASVNYRLAPRYKFPAMIEDCKCAIRFLRANADKYNLDPDKIGAWGGSAGGHLVSLLGVTDATAGFEGSGGYPDLSSRVQAVVDMFGPSDLTVLFNGANPRLLEQVFGTSDRTSEAIQRASPTTWVSNDDPPFLVLQGELDDVVPPSQSQILYDRLVAAGVPATLVMVKNAGHGFAPIGGPISPTRAELTRMLADFFDRHLK